MPWQFYTHVESILIMSASLLTFFISILFMLEFFFQACPSPAFMSHLWVTHSFEFGKYLQEHKQLNNMHIIEEDDPSPLSGSY